MLMGLTLSRFPLARLYMCLIIDMPTRRDVRNALAIDEDDDELDEGGLSNKTTLTSSCAGLVILDGQGIIILVHPTAYEFLRARIYHFFPDGHEDIATTCITYLLMKRFRDEGPCLEMDSLTERWSKYPFLGYAAVNWGYHVKLADRVKVFRSAARLLRNDGARIAAKQALVLNLVGTPFATTEWPESLDRIDIRMF